MKWITKYQYVDLNTGEATDTNKIPEEEKNNEIIIIKTKKNITYVNHSTRTITITKYYRKSKYKQPEIFTAI